VFIDSKQIVTREAITIYSRALLLPLFIGSTENHENPFLE